MRIKYNGDSGRKRSVKAAEQGGNTKFRIDIYKKDNHDALVKREYKSFDSKEAAKKYGQSIADGNTVEVMEVKAPRSGRRRIMAAAGGKIPYDLVSMLVALRDYADVSDAYVNDEHGKLVDIADSLYNVGEEVVKTMKPEFRKVYDKYGKDYFDMVLKDTSAIDSQLTHNNVNDLIADYEDRANNFSGVEGACGGKKSVRADSYLRKPASDDDNTFTYYVSDNRLYLGIPGVYYISRGEWSDPLIEYNGYVYNYYDIEDWLWGDYQEWCETESGEIPTDDGYDDYVNNYISSDGVTSMIEELTPVGKVDSTLGDFHQAKNIDDVEASVRNDNRKSVKASRRAIMAGPGAGYTIKWNLESIKSINSFNVINVSEPDQYGLITAEADCDVDVTIEIMEAYSYYYGIDSPLNDVPAKMTKVQFEIDPEQWPEIGSLYDADVAFAEELLNNEIYDVVSNGEVMYGGGWTHSTWDGTLTDYDHDDLIEVKVTDEEIIQYVDDAVSGALEPAYDEDEHDEYDEVEESRRINSAKSKRRRITASEGSFEANVEKIKYYASKVMEDINAAAQIFQNSGESWTPIEVPDVYVEGDGQLFYEWYVQDYVDLFDNNHSNGGEIIQSYNRRGSEFDVSYGYFNSKDLYNYGDDVESLIEFVEGFNYMEDLYMVTFEYGFTIQDLATDPYKVFNDFDDEDKLYYSEEVLAEFDLWTQSDRQYDLAKDAQGIVDLYKEVSDYFSYDNAEQAAQEFNSGYDDDIEDIT